MKKSEKKHKLSKAELKQKREISNYRRKISSTFTNSGFTYIKTQGKAFSTGKRTVELDYVFIYKNIILICEDTCGNNNSRDHIRNKNEAFNEILENKIIFLDWLQNTFPEHSATISKYAAARYKIHFLYFALNELNLSEEKKELYKIINFIEPQTLDYFYNISQCIQHSAKYEIFRYLQLKNNDIGIEVSDSESKRIDAPIICPENITGLQNDVRVISFMMSAEQLIKMSYVLRKDNWEDSLFLYQRLINKTKIKGIRKFIADKGEAFYNNIIVGLPDNIRFIDSSGDYKKINEINNFEHCKLCINNDLNSICVIDGQHRIYAHYEGSEKDKFEHKIAPLRKELHLLVTGLIFPTSMTETQKIKIQSEIFLDINSNAKPVHADVLLHIKMMKDPLSDLGLARLVIKKLNKKNAFNNRFEMSTLEKGKIKIASIIKFALRYLVTLTPSESKSSIYEFWNGDKEALLSEDPQALHDYVDFCANCLDTYFCAIRKIFNNDWIINDSKLQTVISINGFIIAYMRQLKSNGIQNFEFYCEHLKNLKIDFSREKFPFTSSQYKKFSDLIIIEAFDIIDV